MKIIEAIQEAMGPQYTTLAWREDFTAALFFTVGKKPCKHYLSEVQFEDDES